MEFKPPSIEMIPVARLKPYAGNARTHSRKQVRQIADSISRFGFTNPVLIGDDHEIVAGHGRVMAAKELGIAAVPTVKLSHLSAEERRAYVLADNKLALNAGWDTEILAIELQALIDIDFDVTLTGFSLAEIDLTLDHAQAASGMAEDSPADLIPELPANAVSKRGDIWLLGHHRLLCGDARSEDDVSRLMGGETADLIFTDPPYNVAIDGNVGGLGSVRHREFAFASGEMSDDEFTAFLTTTLSNAARVARDGGIAYVCMDWRHMREVLDAGKAAFSELKNLCVWNKTNGGMGTFYRSKHELIFVFKVGTAPHTNSFGLGETGRYRTNVWDYAGISSLGANRLDQLAMHPTVKPVALVADAIKDCSRRNEIVLDIFGGSGSTLIAAESCGRRARLIEYDPLYCDTIITRWQRYTGKAATLEGSSRTFDDVAEDRTEIYEAEPKAQAKFVKRSAGGRVADKPKSEKPKAILSDDVVERMKAHLIKGETGYGRPPKEHQFKKGQRANPRGRPRKAAPDLKLSEQPLLSAILAVLSQSVRGQDGDKAVEMSAAQAMAQKALAFALKGNARYFGILVEMGRQAEEAKAREIQRNLEVWESYQIATRSLIDDAVQKGEPPPEFLPHPDDIILDTKEGPRFVGPCDDDELKRMQETLRMRDVLLMQDVLDQRSTTRLNGEPLKEPGAALLLAMLLDKALPPRLRMSNAEIAAKQWSYDRMTKRELMRSLYREWRKLGRKIPRGFVTCDLSLAKKNLDFVTDFVGKADEGVLDVEAMANGNFDGAARSFLERHGIPVEGLQTLRRMAEC